MSELTYEAIVAEIKKLTDVKPVSNPYIYRHVDIQLAIQVATSVERERIIKLLEADPEECIPMGGGERAGYESAIALIKGEPK